MRQRRLSVRTSAQVILILVAWLSAAIARAQADPKAQAAAEAAAAADRELEATRRSVAEANARLDVVGDVLAGRPKPGTFATKRLTDRPVTHPVKPVAFTTQPYVIPPDPRLGVVALAAGQIIAPWVSEYDYRDDELRRWIRTVDKGGWFQPMNRDGTPFQKPLYYSARCLAILDFEGWTDPTRSPYDRHPDWTKADVAKLIAHYLAVCRAEAPNVQLALNGVDPNDPTFRDVLASTDVILGDMWYLLAAEWVDRDFKVMREGIALRRKLFPGKPILMFVNSQFQGERLPGWKPSDDVESGYKKNRGLVELTPEVAARWVALCRELADQPGDGILLWSGQTLADQVRVLMPELAKGR